MKSQSVNDLIPVHDAILAYRLNDIVARADPIKWHAQVLMDSNWMRFLVVSLVAFRKILLFHVHYHYTSNNLSLTISCLQTLEVINA